MKVDVRQSLIAAAVAIAVAWAVTSVRQPVPAPHTAQTQETAYDRVVRTGVLRCAYISWSEDYFAKDPVTGAFRGVGYDLAEALAQNLKIKIDWVEEVSVATMYEGLKTGRYDAICTPVWQDASGGTHATFTRAAYYSPVYAYARGDDTRFDLGDPQVLDKINQPSVTVADVDGSNGVEIHKNRYPKAHIAFVPGTAGAPEVIMQVMTHKADITQQNSAAVEDFLKRNPGALKRVTRQLTTFPVSVIVVPKGDERLREWVDLGVTSLLQFGALDRILDVYDAQGIKFLHADPGFRERGGHP